MNNIHSSGRPYTKEEFLEKLKIDKDFNEKYGNKKIDQIKNIVESLKTNPYSRYHILNAWAPHDFKEMALPPCHLLYQFIVRPLTLDQRQNIYRERNNGLMLNFDSIGRIAKGLDECEIPKFYLDLNMYQRSVDSACGLPFNLASMSLLLEIISKVSNMIPGVATWIGGDTHLYIPHIETVKEQIKRTPYKLPKMEIKKDLKTLDDILALTVNDFELTEYESHGKLKAELFTGNKK
jgi:thymidylate synthase